MAYMTQKDLANTEVDCVRTRQIADGVHIVQDTIAQAESRYGRKAGSVTLLAATKTRDVGEIMAALRAGVRVIGENRPQEIVAKAEILRKEAAREGLSVGVNGGINSEIPLYLIGQLQSNKINKVLPLANGIQSIDGIELAQKISTRAQNLGLCTDVMLEVNVSGEATKSGCAPERAIDEALAISSLPSLNLRGFMTLGARVNDEKVVRSGFAALREIRDCVSEQLAQDHDENSTKLELSMGMSGDFAWAIAEGSTMVRIGSAIFGPRAFV
ncbi:YggS family pyridoxal phosphate-dependent enzyme [Gardnerella pickettii]|uniref:YggS family pyridoxal phosphate-dependent enzyme n=1 Tax=Gardnerella pickettii TaxID=2914924 RepID=UPI0039EF619C